VADPADNKALDDLIRLGGDLRIQRDAARARIRELEAALWEAEHKNCGCLGGDSGLLAGPP
jgi:hypothetical protein